jgi:hypothetical protein
MKQKLLLLLMLISGMLYAQEPYRNLIISEIRGNDTRFNYVEITNMGTKTINLAEFELGNNDPWTNPWTAGADRRYRLPNKMLAPGQSYLIASVDDVPLRVWPMDPERFLGSRSVTPEMRQRADLEIHFGTSEWGSWPQYDSISSYGHLTLDNWSGRSAMFLRHYFKETELERDSAIVDTFNANFTAASSPYKTTGASNVAGVTNATENRVLVRKYTVTEGTGDAIDSWTRVAGVDIADSEWLPLRFPHNDWAIGQKREFWTLGNHGNYVLNNQSLKAKTATTVVNFDNKTITVPWGVKNMSFFTDNFEYSPGVAWFYSLSADKADSAFVSARTNDTITFYAVGNTLEEIKFVVNVLPSTNADNIVIPKVPMNYGSARFLGTYRDMGAYCSVTNGLAMDTIMATNFILGIGFSTRVDSLLKYLEKPTQASWQIVYVDGVTRPDVKTGDKLKVTAGNGSTKEYYIKTNRYVPNKIARLSSITWPDVPEFLKGIYGWVGDTIPQFSPTSYDYTINVPAETVGIPALVAKPEALNTSVEVIRASNLAGSFADRTVTFNTTAQDGVTKHSYKVTINKEKSPEDIQPNAAEPFISELVWRDQWASTMIEVVNPGNQILDMSNYMFVTTGNNNPAGAIGIQSLPENWNNRYQKYIPGYRWVDQASWETQPAMVVQDLNVSPIVYPGEVFSIGHLASFGNLGENTSSWRSWWGGYKLDIDFGPRNPWGESIPNALAGWFDTNYYLFRIDNDSIKLGLKPATDPNDFTLIDVFGSGDGVRQKIGGVNLDQIMSFARKPHIYKGNPEFKGSWGTNPDDSEWLRTDRPYWVARGYGWPNDILMITSGIGSHFMNEVTSYKSTVASVQYKVSEGYSMTETIRGVVANTSVDEFLSRILKADPGQKLTLKKATTSAVMAGADKLTNGDMLEVVSADEQNTSMYILNVTERGLSGNAILTSTEYFISVDVTTGGIYNVPYGLTLREVVNNVTLPEGASLTVIDAKNAWVPFKKMNFDTTMVDVMINDQIYFEVVAENGVSKITYQIVPMSSSSDAFVLSQAYDVKQDMGLISYIPRGTTVETLLKNVFPAAGATMKVVDKTGLQRTFGGIYQDDMLIVTSQDGKVTKVYYLDMLRTQFIKASNYLAYVTSDDYAVDQLNKMIAKPLAMSPVAQFLAKLTPSFGATMAVYNKDGQPNTTGVINKGDVLRVTSADGKIVAIYALTLDLTNADQIGNSEVSVYPNPTSGKINVNGVETGSRIRVINMMGATVKEVVANSSIETLSIDNQPAGIYFVVIGINDSVTGTYKLIKK